VIEYKHCWLEDHQFSTYGPPVPCLFILMELANGGSLEEYITASSSHSYKETILAKRAPKNNCSGPRLLGIHYIWKMFLDISSGLEHLHLNGIIHRDLKPSNLLLNFLNPDDPNEIPRLLISDFGECLEIFSTTDFCNRTGTTGTLEFTAPELLRVDEFGKYYIQYTASADLWSLGMVLNYLCFSNLPYKDIDDIDRLKKDILSFEWSDYGANIRQDIPKEITLLIQSLLSLDPSKRPTARQINATFGHMRSTPANSLFMERKSLPDKEEI
jgi:serine/threonine protein kinase